MYTWILNRSSRASASDDGTACAGDSTPFLVRIDPTPIVGYLGDLAAFGAYPVPFTKSNAFVLGTVFAQGHKPSSVLLMVSTFSCTARATP